MKTVCSIASRNVRRVALGLLAIGWGASNAWAIVLPAPTITASAPAFNVNFAAANVFDAFRNTEYASLGGGAGTPLSTSNGTWLHFDFGAPTTIDGFINVTRASVNDAIGASRLIFSNDSIFDAGDTAITINVTGSGGQAPIQQFAPQTARYVRWEVTSMAGTTVNPGSANMWFLQAPAGSSQSLRPLVTAATPSFGGQARFAKENAANGDAGFAPSTSILGTEYASQGGGIDTFVDFDYGYAKQFTGFDFIDRGAISPSNFNDRVQGFNLLFSNDPTFTTGVTLKNYSNPGGTNWTTSDTFAPITARYVRFDVTAANAGANTGLQELIMYTPTVNFVPGDANFDGNVDLDDFQLIATNLFKTVPERTNGDLNFDTAVNYQDFIQWRSLVSPGMAAIAAAQLAGVPEPTSARMLVVAASLLAARSHSRRGQLHGTLAASQRHPS